MLQPGDGGYVVVGYTHSFGEGDFDAWMIRTDEAGDELWSRTHGDGARDQVDWVEPATNGIGIVPWSRDFGGAADAFPYLGYFRP